MNVTRTLVGSMLALLLWAGLAPAADIRDELKTLAEDIRRAVKKKPVKIGVFSPLEDVFSDIGSGLEEKLRTELKSLAKDAVSDDAEFVLAGRFGVFEEKITDGNEVRKVRFASLTVSIHERSGKVIKEIDGVPAVLDPVKSQVPKDMVAFGGGSGAGPPGKFDPYEAVKNPTFFLDGNKVFAKKGGLLGVEIRIKPDTKTASKPVKPTIHQRNKQAFVDIPTGSLYEIVLTNKAKFHAAVSIAIDGLDVFEYSLERGPKGRPAYSQFILKPDSTSVLKGWFHTSDPKRKDNVLSFLVNEYGQGGPSPKKARGKVGLITVTMAAAWQKVPPEDEPGDQPRSTETIPGPPDEQKFTKVSMITGKLREAVTIRYSR